MKRCTFLLLCIFLIHHVRAQPNRKGNNAADTALIVRAVFPRFLRQGDHLELATRIVNNGAAELTGQVQLELVDAITGTSVDGWFINTFPNQYFTVGAHDSETVRFPVQVPPLFSSLLGWRISAATGNDVRDRKSGLMPVLSDRDFHSEKIDLDVKAHGSNSFPFAPLPAGDESIQNQSLTVEALTNPSWYAIETLALLRNASEASAMQAFNRYYACALGSAILRIDPPVAAILEHWRQGSTPALALFLAKDKNLLDETPWLLHAQPEAVQKKLLALQYDSSVLAHERHEALQQLKSLQKKNGGFALYAGGADDENTTLSILQGIAQLQNLSAIAASDQTAIREILLAALEHIDNIATARPASLTDDAALSNVPYLYVRSFFPNTPYPASERGASVSYRRYLHVLETRWKELGAGLRVMAATAFARGERADIAKKMLAAASKQSQPVEIQCLLIEAFKQVGDEASATAMCRQVLNEKEIDGWGSPQATRLACYALLTAGPAKVPVQADIRVGSFTASAPPDPQSASGYFRTLIPQTLAPGIDKITFDPGRAAAAYPGHAYREYLGGKERPSSNPALRLEKRLLYENGRAVPEGTELRTGDRLLVQLRITAVRSLDNLDLHDSWASLFAPTDTSGYKRSGQIDFYQSTGPQGIHFLIGHLARGVYEISYRVRVEEGGEGSTGTAAIHCIDTPAVRASSRAIRVSAAQ